MRIVSEQRDDGSLFNEIPVLVAGRHRLEAYRILGLDYIDAVVSDSTETEAKMWEIAENLHRADLTVLERSEHVAEWIRLSEKKEEVLTQVASKPKGGRPEGGVRAASRDLGIDLTEAQRAVKINSMSPEAKTAAIEAKMDDSQTALLHVAAQPSAEAQLKAIKEKKDHDEAQKQKLNRAEKEASRLKWIEDQKAQAKRIQNAGEFLVKRLRKMPPVIEFFNLLGHTDLSSLENAFRTGSWHNGPPKLLTEAEIAAKFGAAS